MMKKGGENRGQFFFLHSFFAILRPERQIYVAPAPNRLPYGEIDSSVVRT